MSKPVLAVDIDEVIGHFIDALAIFHNETFVDSNYHRSSFFSYDFHMVWGGTPEECCTKFAKTALLRLKQDFDLQIVTARQHKLETATRAWIDDHFPGIFSAVHFGNHYSREGKSRSKHEMCKDIGAVMLIDDSIKYAEQCSSNGIPVLLFGEYAWNRGDIGSEAESAAKDKLFQDKLVRRAGNWLDVLDLIYGSDIVPKRAPVMPNDSLRVAAVQMCSTNNKIRNFITSYEFIEKTLEIDPEVRVICFPENSAFMGATREEALLASEYIHLEGRNPFDFSCLANDEWIAAYNGTDAISYIDGMCRIARIHGIWISLGGFAERRHDVCIFYPPNAAATLTPQEQAVQSIRMSNTHVIISPQGEVVSTYRKMHLFDCPLVGLQESSLTVAGEEVMATDIDNFRTGLSVCYDLRFPYLYEELVAKHLAQVLLVPAAFTVPTGQAHWEVLLRARAIETQCYVVAAAQGGVHNERRTSYGHTMIVDPWGTILAEVRSQEPGVCIATLSKEKITSVRSNMPIQDHRKVLN